MKYIRLYFVLFSTKSGKLLRSFRAQPCPSGRREGISRNKVGAGCRGFLPARAGFGMILFLFYFLLVHVPAYAQVEGDTLPQVEGDTLTIDEIDALLSDDEPEKDTTIADKSVESVVSAKLTQSGKSAVIMSFVRYKATQSPDSLYFNILKIRNNTDERISGTVNINIPDGWKLISRAKNRVRVAPGKSAYIPVRVALSRDARGGVGYVINASMLYKPGMQNRNSEQLLRTDCYVSIPRISKWKIHTPKRVIYFNKQVEYAKFDLYLENKGNAEELIRINFKIGDALAMYGAEGRTYVSTLSLRPNSDTVVVFSVKHIPLEDDISGNGWRGAAISIKAMSGEKTETTALWFRHLESSFTNEKNGGITPLTIEATARNLLADFNPTLDIGAYGTVLLPKNRDVDYYFRASNIASNGGKNGSKYFRTLWQQSRMIANYNTKNARITLGDMGAGMEHAIYGRGIGGSYIFKKNTISAVAVRNVYQPIYGAAIKHEIRLKRGVSIRSGLSYENDDFNKINSASGAIGGSFSFLKVHRLSALFGISNTRHVYTDSTFKLTDTTFATDGADTTLNGFGYQFNYSSKIGKFQFAIRNRYGSRNHTGLYKVRFDMIGDAWYQITKKHRIFFRYSHYVFNPVIYRQGVLLPENSYIRENYELQFVTRVNPKLTLYGGPAVERLRQGRFDYINDTIVTLSTISPRLSMRLTYRNGRYNTLTPYVLMGYTKITESADSAYGVSLSEIDLLRDKPFYNARAGVNVKRQHWGVNAYYYYGPYTIFDQSAYLYGGNFRKSIRILPYFEKYFMNKKVKLSSYNSYFFDASLNTERINLNARLEFFFNKGWTLRINNNIFLYNRFSDEAGKFSSRIYYLDIGFKKVFDIPQPRVKYYDLKVIFYKDLNGNRAMDDNEGGLDYILVKIERDNLADTIINPLGKFAFIELISDQFGEINYYNIPEGNYKITILPLRNIKDLYNINGAEQRIIIKNNTTFYVPFVQANKVTGKIVLVRDEYSSEGAISIADIRITATGSAGNTYSTLTDRQGKFMLFVPQTGRTVVRVNNIFGENFQILQDEFTIDFNGFKEFEIVFKFKEKTRGININGGDLPPGRTFRDRNINGEEESPAPVPDIPEEPTPSPAEPAPGTESPPPEASTEGGLSAPSITWEETNNYIVLASFNNRENAQQFLGDLKTKDNALIVTTPKGMFRVVYGYRTEKEAREDLEKKRSDFPTAWISKKQ